METEMAKRVTGTVVKFRWDKGFGYIGTGRNERDIFFHMNDLKKGIPAIGSKMEFEVVEGPDGKGPRAVEIRQID